MSDQTRLAAQEWAGGEHDFELRLGELNELQRVTGFGPMRLLQRLASGEWFAIEPREIVLQGLIGGGAPPKDARVLVKRYVDDLPNKETLPLAQAILLAWLNGVPKDPPKKRKAPKTKTETTAPAGSTSTPSMDAVQ